MIVQLPMELYNAVLQTLGRLPYDDVVGLRTAMDRHRIVIEDSIPEAPAARRKTSAK